MFDGGFAVGAGGVPVVFGDDAVDAEQRLEEQLGYAGVVLGEGRSGGAGEAGEQARVVGHEGGGDGGELRRDGGDLGVLGARQPGGLRGVGYDGEGGVGADVVGGDWAGERGCGKEGGDVLGWASSARAAPSWTMWKAWGSRPV